jgi:hypothetical protein
MVYSVPFVSPSIVSGDVISFHVLKSGEAVREYNVLGSPPLEPVVKLIVTFLSPRLIDVIEGASGTFQVVIESQLTLETLSGFMAFTVNR